MSVPKRGACPRHRLLVIAAGSVSVLTLAACGDSGSSGSSAGTGASSTSAAGSGASLALTAKGTAFTPTSFTVPGGSQVSVTFQNQDQIEHNFSADTVKADQDVDGGQTKTVTFTAPQSGTLQFLCKYHPTRMTGTITVGPASGGPGAGGSAPPSSRGSTPSSGYGGY